VAKVMNHAEYIKGLRSKSTAELEFTIKDAGEAAAAMPDGENAGYYLDEVSYAADELRRRRDERNKRARINRRARASAYEAAGMVRVRVGGRTFWE